jgi:hypothetical protein
MSPGPGRRAGLETRRHDPAEVRRIVVKDVELLLEADRRSGFAAFVCLR